MKALKVIGIVLLSPLLIFVCVGIGLSNDIEVRRSLVIKATVAEIHAYVGNLEKWPDWSPWMEVDPSVMVTIGDKSEGVGATQSWEGNNGGGRLVFTDVDPAKGIAYDLWIDEYVMPSNSTIAYQTIDGGTRVTWVLKGREPDAVMGGYRAKITMMFCGMGFELGLNKLNNAINPPAPQTDVVGDETVLEPSSGENTITKSTE